jgi:hypothetical protein
MLARRLSLSNYLQHLVIASEFEIPGFSVARFLVFNTLKDFDVFSGNDRNAFFVEDIENGFDLGFHLAGCESFLGA